MSTVSRGKAHVMQFAYRSQMLRDTQVFAKGAVRHPDHATVILRCWHRVAAMNTRPAPRARCVQGRALASRSTMPAGWSTSR